MPDSQRAFAILTAAGPNRPGLLLSMARFVGEHGGNIVRDSVEVYGDRAFLSLYVDLPADALGSMGQARAALQGSTGLEVTLLVTPQGPDSSQPLGSLLAISDDFPGLLARVAAFLAGHGMDILSHQGSRQEFKVPGTDQVRARYVQYFTLRRPPSCDLLAFEDELRALKHAWGVFLRYREDTPYQPAVYSDITPLGDFPAGT